MSIGFKSLMYSNKQNIETWNIFELNEHVGTPI